MKKVIVFGLLFAAVGCQTADEEENNGVVFINNTSQSNSSANNGQQNTMNADMGVVTMLPDGGALPDVDDSCVDGDGDGAFVDCNDFTGVMGPDCDDADADVWLACDTCVDADSDGWVGVCDVYGDQMGPDCDDADSDNWSSCGTCADTDGDGYYDGCDSYVAVDGPDCDDAAASVNPGASEVMDNGVDDDCDPGSLDSCTYTPVPAQNPEPGLLAGVTAEHNRWRWRVGLSPLTWNAALGEDATAYAEQCIWEHDPNRSPGGGFSYVGENLYAGSAQPSNAQMIDAIVSWADERYDYDYGTPIGQTGNALVGHYTQVVWDGSNEVGCGYARCNSVQGLSFSATMVVCRYGPGGNYTDDTPYDFVTDACVDLDNDDVWQGADADDTDRNVR